MHKGPRTSSAPPNVPLCLQLHACHRLQAEAAKMNDSSYRHQRSPWEINLISAYPSRSAPWGPDESTQCCVVPHQTPSQCHLDDFPARLAKEQRSLIANPSPPAAGHLTALPTHGGKQTVQPQFKLGASAQGAGDKIHPLLASAQENAFACYERYFNSANYSK